MSEPEHPERSARFTDPSVYRGLAFPRMSRRSMLKHACMGAGALGLAALLGACGEKGAGGRTGSGSKRPNADVGNASWWGKQPLTKQVNFANWPYYIDTVQGQHPSLVHFTELTGITVTYTESINDNVPFYAKIRPSLQAGRYTGFDLIVMTNNSPPLGYLIELGWLTPLDRSMMTNFDKHAGPLVKNPWWDPGNKYTMAWQSGWASIAYNTSAIQEPVDSVQALFDPKYRGKVGMLADPQELGSIGLLAIGVDPAKSTYDDWKKAAAKLNAQKAAGIVRQYYDASYITALKNGDITLCQCYSGDIYQANLNSKYRDLKLVIPREGAMFWTDNMCIPLYARNPKAAMTLMDYYYDPEVQAVVEYYNNYVCPVPDAKQVLLHPTGWAAKALAETEKSFSVSPKATADAVTVFPDARIESLSHPYRTYKSQEELNSWNSLFLPIIQG
ncbi:MAG TPA: spermidine/putrescine ABC transporter substrate-binding protein [Burkholderiales bacterium]|nr:spermidine/putrescine ABC transporter substrate-binding protein [Burkholderiales bacterium]